MRRGRLQLKRKPLLVEPPAAASSDIAFNLIVFFLVCASNAPQTGHSQAIPRAETQQTQANKAKNLEVSLTSTRTLINALPVAEDQLIGKIKGFLAGKTKPEERIVIVKSASDVSYERWIDATRKIEAAGGVVTLQIEEERRVKVR